MTETNTNLVDIDNAAAGSPKLKTIVIRFCDSFIEAAELVCMHKGNVSERPLEPCHSIFLKG